MLFGCTPTGMGVDAPSDEPCGTLTYENFASGFFDVYCLRCHSAGVTGLLRLGAPADVNYDTYEDVSAFLDLIRDRAGTIGDMPPFGPFPSAEERAMLLNWIDCGAIEQ